MAVLITGVPPRDVRTTHERNKLITCSDNWSVWGRPTWSGRCGFCGFGMRTTAVMGGSLSAKVVYNLSQIEPGGKDQKSISSFRFPVADSVCCRDTVARSLCACGQNEANHGFNDVLFCVDMVCTAHTHGTQHDLRSFLLRKSRLGKSSVYTSMQWMQWQGRVACVLHSCAFLLRSLFPNVSPGNLRTS